MSLVPGIDEGAAREESKQRVSLAHQAARHATGKHAFGITLDAALARAVQQGAVKRSIACATAHRIAQRQVVSPARVGQTIDLLDLKIVKCQMGFFGATPDQKSVQAAKSISSVLESVLTPLLADNRISCADCWEIADQLNVSRLDVAAACDGLNIKVTPCQLGAF